MILKLILLCLPLIYPIASNGESPIDISESEAVLQLNPRQEIARSGSEFATQIETLELAAREDAILLEVENGNVPPFLRKLIAVETQVTILDSSYRLTFFVTPDYLSIGSNTDHFNMPMTPILAQKIMDRLDGIFPTRKMVDLIWSASEVKLTPHPIPPTEEMVTIAVYRDHNDMVDSVRAEFIADHPLGSLVSGHKKDVILSNRIASHPHRVIIYGWHYPNGEPIQPLYSGHINWYVDYSHGIRLVLRKCLLNGVEEDISHILCDPVLYQLISDEAGPMEVTRYDTSRSNYP